MNQMEAFTMKNEMVTNSHFMFKNEELNKLSEQIASYNGNINASTDAHMMTVSNNLCKIAYVMAEIDRKELYKEDGFKSAAEYAMETFEYKHSQAFNLVRVGKKFGAKLLETEYNFTQLVEALPMGAEKFAELDESGEINPEMKATEIREIAKANNAKPRKPAKVKEYYFALGENTVGPVSEADFVKAACECHKFKAENGDNMYAVREGVWWAVWKRVDVVETKEKGE